MKREEALDDHRDAVWQYGMALGLHVRPKTVLVEGTTDADLFALAARLEYESSGIQLLDSQLAVIAAGHGEEGGTRGVIRELVCLRGLARTSLLPDGRQKYRFVGLFDNDGAGKQAVRAAGDFDRSILEYKDVFRLWPTMSRPKSFDPGGMKRTFENDNLECKGLDWEIEDYLESDFIDVYRTEQPQAVRSTKTIGGRTHREFTADGKARFHQFIRKNAVHSDLALVVEVLKALRLYMGLI